MDLRGVGIHKIKKDQYREFAKLGGCQYVCTDVHKKKSCVIFTTGDYKQGFQEFILFDEDLTVENLKTMIEYGVSR